MITQELKQHFVALAGAYSYAKMIEIKPLEPLGPPDSKRSRVSHVLSDSQFSHKAHGSPHLCKTISLWR